MQEKLDLFVKLNNRQPKDSNEFVEFCRMVELNKNTLNSRRTIALD
jgi:hypothetical protein